MASLKSIGVLVSMLCAGYATRADAPPPVRKWAVYYSDLEAPERFAAYDLLVFDADSHPALEPLKNAQRVLLGYISLGEAEQNRRYFAATEPYRLSENPNWPGSYFIDVRDRRWQRLVVSEIAPAVLARGFDGFFIDTVDNPIELERQDPVRYAGMKAATAILIRELRRRYPNAPIAMNRGYQLLPEVGQVLSYVLGESVYHTWDFRRKHYRHVPRSVYESQLDVLKNAAADFPRMQVLTLDYCNPSNEDRVREIYRTQRANGFQPYVSTIELNRLQPEPGK